MKYVNLKISMGLIILILLTSCDPTYPISITNRTTDSITIWLKKNNSFRTIKTDVKENPDGLTILKLRPNEMIRVGMAIAEIDNDMPFSEIYIKTEDDSISANGIDELKDLFDKNIFGRLKKSYNMSIENKKTEKRSKQ